MGMLVTRRSQPIWDDMDRLFERLWGQAPAAATTANPLPTDIVEVDNALQFVFALPGAKPEEIDLTVEEGILTVTGEWAHNWESDENAKVYRREVRSGKFTRSLRLPDNLNVDAVEATFNHGLLTVKIPRQEEIKAEPKRIAIRNANVIEASNN